VTDEPQDTQFFPVEIQAFRNSTRDINFDIFLKISDGNVAHVFSRSTGLDYKRLAQYIQKGVKQLWIKHEDRQAFEAFILRTAEAIFTDPETPTEKRIATLLNMTEQNMSELFTQCPVSQETAQSSQKVVKGYVSLMTQNPKTLAIILKLVSHGEYLYYHSIAVSIFSMLIAKASGQFNRRTLEIVGLGGFLHDIGSIQLPKEIVCSPTELTPEQWEVMKSHPKLGLSMIENTPNLPDEVRYIVYQHHEEPSGKGYPNGIHGPVIYYPAKIVAVADAFSALISKRPFRAPFTVDQAIATLREQTGKYDRELVKIMGSVFLRENSAGTAQKKPSGSGSESGSGSGAGSGGGNQAA
jgi:putative nucleotidyltransferase with HDIG domain